MSKTKNIITCLILIVLSSVLYKKIENFISSIRLYKLEHLYTFNINIANTPFYDFDVGRIIRSRDFTLSTVADANDIILCKSVNNCSVNFTTGNKISASYTLENYYTNNHFTIHIRVIIEGSTNKVNISEITNSLLDPDNDMSIFIESDPMFRDLYEIKICTSNNFCRRMPWSSNQSIPDIKCKIPECNMLKFEKKVVSS